MRQFFLVTDPDRPPRVGDTVTLDAEEGRHLKTVLRGGREATLVLVDGRGLRMTARALPGGKSTLLEILSVEDALDENASPRLVLACAVIKGRRFEWVLEKAVELGAHRIIPLRTGRGVVEAGPGKGQRWDAILNSALKQSGRAYLPDLGETADLAAVLADRESGPVLFGAVPGETEAGPWTDLLAERPDPPPAALTLLIGPEGGWTPDERSLLIERGARPVVLAPHVLRTETAALAGLTALQALRIAWRTPREA